MNPMTNIKNTQKISDREIELGTAGTKNSWHNRYKDSAWIFIGGLPYDLTEGDVICVFSQCGELVNCNMVRDPKTGKSKGFMFLCYEDQRSTILAVDNLNGIKLLNRTIRVDHVLDYKPPKDHENDHDMTKLLKSVGCAPVPVSGSESSEDPLDEFMSKKDKKKKKKLKKEKKKKRKNQSQSESDEAAASGSVKHEEVVVKKEKIDPGYRDHEHGHHGNDGHYSNGNQEDEYRRRHHRVDHSDRVLNSRDRRSEQSRDRRSDETGDRRDDDSRDRRGDNSRDRRDDEIRDRRDDEIRDRRDDDSRDRRGENSRGRRDDEIRDRNRTGDEIRDRRSDETRDRRGDERTECSRQDRVNYDESRRPREPLQRRRCPSPRRPNRSPARHRSRSPARRRSRSHERRRSRSRDRFDKRR